MATLLLVVIYIVFISLGLPDGVFGGAWPAIRQELNQSLEIGGFVALVVTLMTILSSLATSELVRRLGIGLLLTISVALTAFALIGFSQAPSITWLFLFAIPLGLGAGAIDSALNNYMALHYKAHHMNWLHGFWGVGATAGPMIFATALATSGDWHAGYFYLGILQIGIVCILIITLALWNRVHPTRVSKNESHDEVSFRALLFMKSVRYTFVAFLIYTGLEVAVGLWLASYLVNVQNVTPQNAALWTGLYFAAITVGRLATGFVSFKMKSSDLVRVGLVMSFIGVAVLAIGTNPIISIVGVILIGIGFAPIYPSLIHLTPERFGKQKASKVMSLQMVGGYVGVSLIPPIIGVISGTISLLAFIVFVPLLLIALAYATERLEYLYKRQATHE